jgi:hypothetical protein
MVALTHSPISGAGTRNGQRFPSFIQAIDGTGRENSTFAGIPFLAMFFPLDVKNRPEAAYVITLTLPISVNSSRLSFVQSRCFPLSITTLAKFI